MKDKAVRQAMAQVINRDELVAKVYGSQAEPPGPPGFTRSEPIRLPGPVAFFRETASLISPPSGFA